MKIRKLEMIQSKKETLVTFYKLSLNKGKEEENAPDIGTDTDTIK